VTATSASVALRPTAVAQDAAIRVGATTACVINVANDRSLPDQNVQLSIEVVGDGLSVRVTGAAPTPVAATSTTAIDFGPIRTLRPGEQLPTPYCIEVRGEKPGRHKLKITANSELSPSGVVNETEFVVTSP